uniref:AlNc14C355G10941 protein n=1 Tax=Albugo laibachii Nc14 TaxID=890382 RepID=F0WXJ0_9STRA|nr:AlNc14C355G10941 [Albugo laibachii Nc14]|eukprot:CCA26184.1 AlNc14C355G10941 [Albugo laibachii Nc14]
MLKPEVYKIQITKQFADIALNLYIFRPSHPYSYMTATSTPPEIYPDSGSFTIAVKVLKDGPQSGHFQFITTIIEMMSRLTHTAHKKHTGIFINKTRASYYHVRPLRNFRKLVIEFSHSIYDMILHRLCQLCGVSTPDSNVRVLYATQIRKRCSFLRSRMRGLYAQITRSCLL